MAATWSDFTFVGATSGTRDGVLSISNVQPNDIIIAVSSAYRYWGGDVAAPVHTPGGVSTEVIHEQNTVPAEVYYYGYWYWYYYYYWYYWWPYWYYYPWYYYYYRTITRVSIYKAVSSGTISVSFQRGYEGSPIYKTQIYVWRPNITVGQNELIRKINFAPSAQGAEYRSYTVSMPVSVDDLLLATSTGVYTAPLSPHLSGVTAQNLVNYTANFGVCYTSVQLWRIKTSGTAVVQTQGANVAQQLTKIIPNVEIAQVAIPSIPPEASYFYVEIGAELFANGQVVRPRWFEEIRTTYAWNNGLGLRKRWVKGTTWGENTGRARLVELWKVPKGAENLIPNGEAYVFTSDQDAESRVLFHDLGW